MRGWGQSAQRLDAGHEARHLGVGGDQAFCVQFAEGDVEGPLIRTELSETIQGQIDAFAPMRMPVARQQEGIGGQVVSAAVPAVTVDRLLEAAVWADRGQLCLRRGAGLNTL
jgi:hypothetical protein